MNFFASQDLFFGGPKPQTFRSEKASLDKYDFKTLRKTWPETCSSSSSSWSLKLQKIKSRFREMNILATLFVQRTWIEKQKRDYFWSIFERAGFLTLRESKSLFLKSTTPTKWWYDFFLSQSQQLVSWPLCQLQLASCDKKCSQRKKR